MSVSDQVYQHHQALMARDRKINQLNEEMRDLRQELAEGTRKTEALFSMLRDKYLETTRVEEKYCGLRDDVRILVDALGHMDDAINASGLDVSRVHFTEEVWETIMRYSDDIDYLIMGEEEIEDE